MSSKVCIEIVGEVQKPENSNLSSRQKVYTSKVKVKFVPKFLENGHACVPDLAEIGPAQPQLILLRFY